MEIFGSRLQKKIAIGRVVVLLLGVLSSGGAKRAKASDVIDDVGKTLGQPIIFIPRDCIAVGMSSISSSGLLISICHCFIFPLITAAKAWYLVSRQSFLKEINLLRIGSLRFKSLLHVFTVP